MSGGAEDNTAIQFLVEDNSPGGEKAALLGGDNEQFAGRRRDNCPAVVAGVPLGKKPIRVMGFMRVFFWNNMTLAQWIYFVVALGLAFGYMWLRQNIRSFGSDTFATIFLITLVFIAPAGRAETPPAAAKPTALAPKALESVAAAPPAKKPAAKPRLLYLDNLKAALTFFLVYYHIANAFGAAGWSPFTLSLGNYTENTLGRVLSVLNMSLMCFFIALFFFVSGYFTPSSLGRKGAVAFLEDKFMRLGIPLALGAFLGYPLYVVMSMKAAFGRQWGMVILLKLWAASVHHGGWDHVYVEERGGS